MLNWASANQSLDLLTVHGRETLKFAYECQTGFHPQEPDVSEQLRKARQKSQAALLRQGTAGDAAEAGSFIGTPQGVILVRRRESWPSLAGLPGSALYCI